MVIRLILTALLIAGLFIYFGLTPKQIAGEIEKERAGRPPTIKKLIDEANGVRHYNIITRQFVKAKEILEATGRGDKYGKYRRISILLACAGVLISILLNNVLLLPILAAIGFILPMMFLRYTAAGFKRRTNAELETVLSMVTGSYLRTENIVTSIKENVEYMHAPVKGIFEWFLTQTQLINPDIESAIAGMKRFINNGVFHEWCDTLVLCQSDRNLKNMLQPTVNKLTDMRVVQGKLNTKLFRPVRDFVMMLIATVMLIPALFFLNRQWFINLFTTMPGKISLAIVCAALLFSMVCIIKATRPLEYRR